MDVINEQKDKPSSNKPPLLPKPCLASMSSGPAEHVIPQMVITSPEDNESSSETACIPEVFVTESPSTDASDELKDTDFRHEITQSVPVDDGIQPSIQTVDVTESEKETKVDDSFAHSAVQRPLIFESEKCVSESNMADSSIPTISESPSPPPLLPTVTSQRPMVFGGSNQQPVAAEEEFFVDCNLDISLAKPESQEADGIILDELNLNEEFATPEPDSKSKSSSFSWMPTFSKLHASGKELKTSEAGPSKKDQEAADIQKMSSSDQSPVKKDGLHNMKKFFDNLLHDTSSESKSPPSPDNQNIDASGESIKKGHKDGKHGIKKLFSPSKQDSKLSEKEVLSETIKDIENVPKEQAKDSKSNIKKMFDSFKPIDKKDGAAKKDQEHPQIESTSTSNEPKKEDELKEHPKESKSNLKKMFDSFKPIDKKDGAAKKDQEHPQNEDTSMSNEPKKEDELKEHSKDSKSNFKKMFDSFKPADKKDSPIKKETDVPQIEVTSTQDESKKVTEHPKDSKSNLKKMFDSFKPVDKKDEAKKEKEFAQIETSSDLCKTEKESRSGIKKFMDSFKHEDVLVKANTSNKSAEIDNVSRDKKNITAPKIKSSLKHSSDIEHSDNEISNYHDSIPNVASQDTPSSKIKSSLKHSSDIEHSDNKISNYHDSIPNLASQGTPTSKIKSSLKHSSDIEHPDNKMPNYHDLIPNVASQDTSTSKIKNDQTKPKEEVETRQRINEHGVKKFFQSFRLSDTPSTSKEPTSKFHVKFLDRETSLKRSHSFQESILVKEPKASDELEKIQKESFQGVRKYFSSSKTNDPDCVKATKETKSKEIKRSQSCKETLAEKEGLHGIRGFFDSFTHKSSAKVSSQTALSPSSTKEEHIYDVVGKPVISASASQVVQEDSSKITSEKVPETSKEDHSGVRKLFDSFLHKESSLTKQKDSKEEGYGERIYEKIDISSSVERPSLTGRTFIDMKRERVANEEKSESVLQTGKSQKPKESKIPKSSPDILQQKKSDTNVPSIQVNESSTSTDTKTSVFHSIGDNFMAIKDKMLHSKVKKTEVVVNNDKVSEEYDLQIAASKNDFPDISAGTFRPLKDDSFVDPNHRKETEANKNGNILDNSFDLSLPSTSVKSSSNPVISDTKPSKRPDTKASSKIEPGTPDTLYDTCCVRIARLLGKKALEIVSDKTKTPPKKPPKPSAEAIAKARAEVVSQRLRNLQSKGLSIGESIPVGYDGIRFADDETESSCDYKDVDNLDYILDYELINRYKFDRKVDTFSAQSTCSVSSYYTADTVTLKDEQFSDAPLETISLGSNESLLFQHLSSNNETDFNSLPAKVKAKDKNVSKLKPLDKNKDASKIPTVKKKVPPPLPPKPVLSPKVRNIESNKKDSVSQCINGLSLSPRLQSKFSKDTAATQKRPLLVAGLKGTEFTSLQTKSKDTQNKRTFNTVLKNESLKKISTISPLHPPLQSTKSSPPQLSEDSHQSTKPKKIGPERPPPPFSPGRSDDTPLKTNAGPPVPEKPKRENKSILSQEPSGKRTISPIRPPPKPPIVVKTNIPPPRPPPPISNFKPAVKHPSYQNVENHSEAASVPQSFDEQPGSSNSFESDSEKYADALENSPVEASSPEKFIEINLHESYVEKEGKKTPEKSQSPHKLEREFTPSLREDYTTPEPDSEIAMSLSFEHSPQSSATCSPLPTSTPKPPPRTRRIRSRTVEIAPKESVKKSLPRRSQSLTDLDIQKRTESLNVPVSSEKGDLKHLYTSINKDGKRPVSNGSQSPSLGCRPLPAPPPPPRKLRSLDRKPKEKKSQECSVSNADEKKNRLSEFNLTGTSMKPPERKKKGDKHRFYSLSTERKKNKLELTPEASTMPRSSSVPLKPDRRFRHGPEYDENANFAFPVVAEVHHSAILLDECGNEILESPNANIPSEDTVDSSKHNSVPIKICPQPRQKKDKNSKIKSHSSWYDENQTSAESWEVVDWDPKFVSEEAYKDIHTSRKKPLRRRSDPLAGRKERRTSQFYVDVELDEGLPHVDKETSPLHLDCSEKSVQTSLETLSQGLISRDEQSENAESSDNTDNLISMVKTLQTELKSTLDRHKILDSDETGSSSNAPIDSDKASKPRKLSKSLSIHSTTPEHWPATSSEESDGEICPDAAENLSEIALTRKKKKVFYIAQEIMTSEEVFVDTLKLLNVDFKEAIETANKQRNTPVLPDEVLSQILNHLPQLQHLNENLLSELKDRIDNWDKTEKIADVIVKMGPFLKLYSWFIHDFESNLSLLEESKKKYPLFAQSIKEFEASPRCKRLTVNHFMLKPIQRIPQYRLLLQEYLHNLSEDSPDYQDTVTALQIVSEVANHANDSMKQGDNAQKLISIQNSIMGHKEIIKPGRLFIKEGELMKLSRKGMQPRWFVLFNDLLLYLTPVQQGLYRINHEFPLTGMRVAIPQQQDYQNEFSIISVARSFTLAARSQEEREEWIDVLENAIKENASKRSTFTNTRLSQRVQGKSAEDDSSEFVLGRKAPVWIPDARVTMCQLCTSEFTVTFRRHHCRACGKVICSICSSYRIPLAYLGGHKVNRVCDECYSKLGPDAGACLESGETDSDNQQIAVKPHLRTEKYVKKYKRNLPSVLKEVCANDQGSTISGYLQKRIGKSWKREWFVVKDKVLYEYKASEDVAALRSIPLLGYKIESFSEAYENVDSSLLFQLTHPGQAPIIFYADSVGSTERWIAALKEASVLE